MNRRRLASALALGLVAVFALAACGGDVPSTAEELGREVHERALGDFNDGFRSACESRGLGRFTGGLSDDVCECALRVVRKQVAEDELVPLLDDGLELPEAVAQRSLEVCLPPPALLAARTFALIDREATTLEEPH